MTGPGWVGPRSKRRSRSAAANSPSRPPPAADAQSLILGRVAQLELDEVHPVGSARRQDLVVEVVEWRMHVVATAFDRAAIADHDVGARLLLQHEGEVLSAGDRRCVGL